MLSPARLWNEGGTSVKILEGCANKFLLVSTIGNVNTTVWRISQVKKSQILLIFFLSHPRKETKKVYTSKFETVALQAIIVIITYFMSQHNSPM